MLNQALQVWVSINRTAAGRQISLSLGSHVFFLENLGPGLLSSGVGGCLLLHGGPSPFRFGACFAAVGLGGGCCKSEFL